MDCFEGDTVGSWRGFKDLGFGVIRAGAQQKPGKSKDQGLGLEV